MLNESLHLFLSTQKICNMDGWQSSDMADHDIFSGRTWESNLFQGKEETYKEVQSIGFSHWNLTSFNFSKSHWRSSSGSLMWAFEWQAPFLLKLVHNKVVYRLIRCVCMWTCTCTHITASSKRRGSEFETEKWDVYQSLKWESRKKNIMISKTKEISKKYSH